MTLVIDPSSATERAIDAERSRSGFTEPGDPRRYLIHLAVKAGYDFRQITLMLRSGRGDERADLYGRQR